MPDFAALFPPDTLMAAHGAVKTAIEGNAFDIDSAIYRIIGPGSLYILFTIRYELKRMREGQEVMAKTQKDTAEILGQVSTEQEVEKEKLRSHMADDSMHCKGLRCSREVQGG